MAKLLSREAILNVSDIQTKLVHVPEWGGDVMVRGLSGKERDAYEQSIISTKGQDVKMNLVNAKAKLVGLSIIDESGARLFSDADVEALGAKSGKAINRVYAVAAKLSGLSDEDMKELTGN
ncbi:hypothetical protein [Paenibacillus naphthalenovorans]|uniref:hypothetical protein n=1 Tax=Paenibacillus naphthalenovorans TaxID=162209 RepID=UPI003D2806B9